MKAGFIFPVETGSGTSECWYCEKKVSYQPMVCVEGRTVCRNCFKQVLAKLKSFDPSLVE